MNPYDFIPLGLTPSPRGPRPGHHLLGRSAGSITARLTTLGPFLVAEQNLAGNTIGPLRQGQIIPGSTIKGMLRSLVETVGGGCISLSGSLYPRGRYQYSAAREPTAFSPCSKVDELCVSCLVFGSIVQNEAWKGMVEPGEAVWRGEGVARTRLLNVIVGQPKPEHHAFYTRSGEIRGRKAYYHHPEKLIVSSPAHKVAFGARQVIQVRALEPGQVYEFTVRHSGLSSEAYALLIYALFLDGTPDMAHKLGWGKPMGLGSVRIEPLAIEEVDLRARYRRGGEKATTRYEGTAAAQRALDLSAPVRDRTDAVMTALRRLLAFPGPATAEWRYPTYDWFKSNPQASLEEFNRGRER